MVTIKTVSFHFLTRCPYATSLTRRAVQTINKIDWSYFEIKTFFLFLSSKFNNQSFYLIFEEGMAGELILVSHQCIFHINSSPCNRVCPFIWKKNTWIPFIQDALCSVWFKWTQCSWEKKMKMLKFYENTTTTDIFLIRFAH